MKNITKQDFVDMMMNLPLGALFLTVITKTIPSMNKTGNPFYMPEKKDFNLRKISKVNGIVHFNYQNNVNAQREREGNSADFVAAEAAWGERIGKTCIIQHNGELYLEYRAIKHISTEYVDIDGNSVNPETVKPWEKKSSSPKQDLEKEIIVRKPMIKNIIGITINGENYVIV